MEHRNPQANIAVVGAGLSGMVAALALARSQDVLLFDGRALDAHSDIRASFLSGPSLRMLSRLGVGVEGQPVTRIAVGEGEPGQPLRGTPLEFGEGETLGQLVENEVLRRALVDAVRASSVELREGVEVHSLDTDTGKGGGGATLKTSDGEIRTCLVVAADGPRSRLRTDAGIGVETHDYKRRALTFTVSHTLSHKGVASQIFMPNGPLALLPLASSETANRSSVVWTDSPAAIRVAEALTPEALAAELARRVGDSLGTLTVVGPVQSYPLHQVLAESLISERLALVGDAAHVIHPLAGQGLNLGLRDAGALADVVAEAASLGRDIGGPALGEYDRWRRGDVRSMALATDALGHAYGWTGMLGAARRLGTAVVGATPLKRAIAREAVGERENLPRLMA